MRKSDPGIENFGFDEPAFGDTASSEPFDAPAQEAPKPRRPRRRASIAAPTNDVPHKEHHHHEPAAAAAAAEQYGYGDPEPAAAPTRRRTRRASMYGEARMPPGASKSCDGLDAMRRPPGSRSGDSVASGDSRDAAPARPMRRGRRASVSGGSFASTQAIQRSMSEPVDYGYGDAQPVSAAANEYGYGDAQPSGFGSFDDGQPDYGYGDQPQQEEAPKKQRERSTNQRKLLDDLKSGDLGGGGGGGISKQATSSRDLGAAIRANVVLPMAAQEKPQARSRRRASLIGAINLGGGGNNNASLMDDSDHKKGGLGLFKDRKASRNKSEEKLPQYDPSKDRERRSGSVLDRVSSGERASSGATRREAGTSYSDRILQGR